MKKSDFLEIFALVYSIHEFCELRLDDVNLKVLINIVNQEAHMLTQLHDLTEHLPSVEVLHAPDSLSPYIL